MLEQHIGDEAATAIAEDLWEPRYRAPWCRDKGYLDRLGDCAVKRLRWLPQEIWKQTMLTYQQLYHKEAHWINQFAKDDGVPVRYLVLFDHNQHFLKGVVWDDFKKGWEDTSAWLDSSEDEAGGPLE